MRVHVVFTKFIKIPSHVVWEFMSFLQNLLEFPATWCESSCRFYKICVWCPYLTALYKQAYSSPSFPEPTTVNVTPSTHLTSALGVFLSRLLQIPTPYKPSVAAGISLQVNGIYPFLPHYKGTLLSLLRVRAGSFQIYCRQESRVSESYVSWKNPEIV